MENGLSVLFVAKKAAALQAGQARLAAAGLEDFCLELHGSRIGKKLLLDSVQKRLNRSGVLPPGLERRRAELRQATEELAAVSSALSEPVGPEGRPLHDLVWHVELLRQALPADFSAPELAEPEHLDMPTFQRLRKLFEELGVACAATPRKALSLKRLIRFNEIY